MSTKVSFESVLPQATELPRPVLTESVGPAGFRPTLSALQEPHAHPFSSLLWHHIAHNSLLASLHSASHHLNHSHPPNAVSEPPIHYYPKPTQQPMGASVKVEEESQPAQEPQEQDEFMRQKLAIGIMQRGIRNDSEREWMVRYRESKVQRYLGKKSKRSFIKKIVYATRKRVADRRIRYKGKFINEVQAREMLGVTDEAVLFEELRRRMEERAKSPQ